MKKNTLLISFLLFSVLTFAQTLNQAANWPNTNWTITGTYLTGAAIFEANPTVSANFAYDEDDAGSASTTNIAAESPIIDLTAAYNAGETYIYVTAQYVYNGVTTDMITFEYWDADASEWVIIGDPIIEDTENPPLDNFCSGTYESFTHSALVITSFTANQLSNFKYRIHYNDMGVWGWGFCFQSPTIYSTGCPNPVDLEAISVTNNSIGLNWTETGTATKWNIQYGVDPYNIGSGLIAPSTTIPYTLTGLTPNTTYAIYVQANCGGGSYSGWVGPIYVTTLCDPTVAPYTEDFENSGAIPSCWTQGDDNYENWLFSDFSWNMGPGTSPSGGYFAYVDDDYPDSMGTTLYTPLMDISALTAPAFSFYYNSDNGNATNVEFSVDIFDGTTWHEDVYFTDTDTYQWKYILIDLAPYAASGTVQARFVVDETVAWEYQNDLMIDDVTFDEMPSCPPVMEIFADNFTTEGADVSWTSLGTETSWAIEYGYEGFAQGSGTTVTAGTNPYTLTGLESGTDYEIYITADCGSETSIVTGPYPLRTLCDIYPSPFLETFDNGGEIPNCWEQGASNGENWLFTDNPQWTSIGNNGTITGSTTSGGYLAYIDDDWPDSMGTSLITPTVDVSGLAEPALVFYLLSNNQGASNNNFSVDIYDGSAWHIGVYSSNTNTNGWKLVAVDLAPYITGAPIRARFVVDEVVQWNWTDDVAIDDVMFDEMPDCMVPSDLSVSNIGTFSADIAWAENGTAEAWNLQYGPVGFTPGTGTTIDVYTNPATIEELTDGTTYDVYVQSACGDSNSLWVGPVTLTTACLPFGDFTEDFDSYDYGEIPLCWTAIESTNSAWSYIQVQTWNYHSASSGIEMYNSDATSGDLMLVTPMLSALPAGTHRAKFFAVGSTWSVNTIEVGTLTSITDPSTFTPISTIALNGSWTQYIVDFNTPTTDAYVAIRHAMTGTYQSAYIDDFVWTAIPTAAASCASNVVSTPDDSCGNFDNTISWDIIGDADGYYLTVGTTSGGNDILDNEDLGFVDSYVFAGEMDTTYYYTLTPYNSYGMATGCPEMSFTTVTTGCYCTSNPMYFDELGITDVSISGVDFTPDGSTYIDYTDTPVTIAQGVSANTFLTFQTWSTSYTTAIWIDFNDNYTFEPSEQVYLGASASSSPTTLNASFIVPATATLGQHRMRINAVPYYYTYSSCYNDYTGLTLDFTVNVIVPSCSPAAFDSAITNHDCDNNQFSVDVNVTDLGDGTPTISDGTNSWPVTATGVINVGPFPYGTPVSLYLLHGGDSVCDLPIATYNYVACPPVNDDLCGALPLTVIPTGSEGSTPSNAYSNVASTGQTNEPTPGCFNGGINGSVWFSFVAPASGEVKVTTDYSGATLIDTEIAVYDATGVTCDDLTTLSAPVGCDQDSGTVVNFNSVILFDGNNNATLIPGNTYYIQLDRWSTTTNGTFAIEVIDLSPTATASFEGFSFTYYPNPVNNNELNLSASSEITNINVYNLLGQQVLKLIPNASTYKVDMSQLSAGTYFVEVAADEQSKTIKILKE